jgi:hypothetical protein
LSGPPLIVFAEAGGRIGLGRLRGFSGIGPSRSARPLNRWFHAPFPPGYVTDDSTAVLTGKRPFFLRRCLPWRVRFSRITSPIVFRPLPRNLSPQLMRPSIPAVLPHGTGGSHFTYVHTQKLATHWREIICHGGPGSTGGTDRFFTPAGAKTAKRFDVVTFGVPKGRGGRPGAGRPAGRSPRRRLVRSAGPGVAANVRSAVKTPVVHQGPRASHLRNVSEPIEPQLSILRWCSDLLRRPGRAVDHASRSVAPTISRMSALTFSGSLGQASMSSARSGSLGAESPSTAPPLAPPLSRICGFPQVWAKVFESCRACFGWMCTSGEVCGGGKPTGRKVISSIVA